MLSSSNDCKSASQNPFRLLRRRNASILYCDVDFMVSCLIFFVFVTVQRFRNSQTLHVDNEMSDTVTFHFAQDKKLLTSTELLNTRGVSFSSGYQI